VRRSGAEKHGHPKPVSSGLENNLNSLKGLDDRNGHAADITLRRGLPLRRAAMPLMEVHLIAQVFNPEQKLQMIRAARWREHARRDLGAIAKFW
jgi:hypothetical protein